jgi:histidinol dehydrogenase
MKIINGFADARQALARKSGIFMPEPSPELKNRLRTLFGTEDPAKAVAVIVDDVKRMGDAALLDLTERIDGLQLQYLEVPAGEIVNAAGRISRALLTSLRTAAKKVSSFHRRQMNALEKGVRRMAPGTLPRTLERVGVYVPGGTASYPSSVFMTVIPARVAGVKQVIMATPPGKDGRVPPLTLAAANMAGVDRVFAVGGAQAIAAMAYGTESIPAVDKICGPGNLFVMLAKKLVYGMVAIDGLQGPSEVMIIADDTANPEWVARDILAQAEHDALAQSILITTSGRLAHLVLERIEGEVCRESRKLIIQESLESRGIVAVVDTLDEALMLSNLYAPEHLSLYINDSQSFVASIKNAGCVFTGSHPTAVIGDYVAGPSHALPTGGTARFASPLNVSDFIHYMNVVETTPEMIKRYGPVAAALARAEGLAAHSSAVALNYQEDSCTLKE